MTLRSDGEFHVYVALSRAQDECTLNNRAFDTYEEAASYAREVDEDSGCQLYVIAVNYVASVKLETSCIPSSLPPVS